MIFTDKPQKTDTRLTSIQLSKWTHENENKGISRQAVEDFCRNHNIKRDSAKKYSLIEFAQARKEAKESLSSGGDSLKEEKLKKEIEKLQIQIEKLRGELIPYEEHLQEITAHAHLMIQGLDEFESIAAAEFPESPRMLECAQKVSDRVRGIMFEKAKKIETSEV